MALSRLLRREIVRKLMAIGVIGLVAVFAGTPTAQAAQPQNQACLGKDFSGYARNVQPNLGQVLTHFTLPNGTPIIRGGLGDEIQGHLAGAVPDSVLPNTCND
jgi:hypothetical protein